MYKIVPNRNLYDNYKTYKENLGKNYFVLIFKQLANFK